MITHVDDIVATCVRGKQLNSAIHSKDTFIWLLKKCQLCLFIYHSIVIYLEFILGEGMRY
jgi:hypothetical protein